MQSIELHNYDLIVINSSGGKDSLCAIWEVCRIAQEQKYPKSKIVVSHQDLGVIEWPQTKALASQQAALFGLKVYYSQRRTKQGITETILDYARRRRKWPSNTQRWCTSDFKRGPGARVVTMLTKDMKKSNILYVFGFRKQESPNRAKKEAFVINNQLTTKSRQVWDWLPIQDWSTEHVWEVIKDNKLPYHYAYDLGMPRLSCMFCIFSPFDALVIAGKHNYQMLEEYVKVEEEIQHTFRNGFSIASVKEAIDNGYQPQKVADWIM